MKPTAFLMFWHEAKCDPRMAAINHELYRDYRDVMAKLFERAAEETGIKVETRSA